MISFYDYVKKKFAFRKLDKLYSEFHILRYLNQLDLSISFKQYVSMKGVELDYIEFYEKTRFRFDSIQDK